jgi:hypothetical protein
MGLSYPIDKYQVWIPRVFFVETADRLRKSSFLFHSFVFQFLPVAITKMASDCGVHDRSALKEGTLQVANRPYAQIFPIGGFRVRRLAGN